MDQELKDQIRSQMLAKDTEELIGIWKENDRTEWSDEAFDVIREVLMLRTGGVPAQKPAEAGEEDVSYNFDRLAKVSVWASTLSWFFFGLGLVMIVVEVVAVFANRGGYPFLTLISSLVPGLLVAMVAAFFFVLLQLISEGIYVLTDIEENTRKSARRQSRVAG